MRGAEIRWSGLFLLKELVSCCQFLIKIYFYFNICPLFFSFKIPLISLLLSSSPFTLWGRNTDVVKFPQVQLAKAVPFHWRYAHLKFTSNLIVEKALDRTPVLSFLSIGKEAGGGAHASIHPSLHFLSSLILHSG